MTFRSWIHASMAALIAISGTTLSLATHAADEKAKGDTAEKSNKEDAQKPEETVTTEIGGLELKLPKSWIQSDAALPMRLATFEVPAAEGDKDKGEFVLSSFPGGGGGVDANIGRWIGQFNAEGRKVSSSGDSGKERIFHRQYLRDLSETGWPADSSQDEGSGRLSHGECDLECRRKGRLFPETHRPGCDRYSSTGCAACFVWR